MSHDPRVLELLERLEELKPYFRSLLLRSSLPSDADADVFQEMALSALKARFPIASPKAYFLTIFRRTKARYWKVHGETDTYDFTDLVELAPTVPASQVIAAEARQLLASLPIQHARALYLRYVLEYSPEEVASKLGWALGTPRKSLRRLREKFQAAP